VSKKQNVNHNPLSLDACTPTRGKLEQRPALRCAACSYAKQPEGSGDKELSDSAFLASALHSSRFIPRKKTTANISWTDE
jgi:hypothetical protein